MTIRTILDKTEVVGPSPTEGPIRRTNTRIVCDDCHHLSSKSHRRGHIITLMCDYSNREVTTRKLLSSTPSGKVSVITPEWCPYLGNIGAVD